MTKNTEFNMLASYLKYLCMIQVAKIKELNEITKEQARQEVATNLGFKNWASMSQYFTSIRQRKSITWKSLCKFRNYLRPRSQVNELIKEALELKGGVTIEPTEL